MMNILRSAVAQFTYTYVLKNATKNMCLSQFWENECSCKIFADPKEELLRMEVSGTCVVCAKSASQLTDSGISINLSVGCVYVDLEIVVKINGQVKTSSSGLISSIFS